MQPTGAKIFGWAAPGELGVEDPPLDPAVAAIEPPIPTAAARTVSAQPENHRGARRNRVLMEGKVTYALGARSIDCTIRDLSETGARVRLSGPEPVPETVVLIQMRSGVAYEAAVAWAKDRDLGLTFLAAHRLNEDCPPDMAPLRRLWLEHLPR